jgi:hypothetical protein
MDWQARGLRKPCILRLTQTLGGFQSTGTFEPPDERRWRGGRWIDINRAATASMASAGTKKTCEAGSPITLTSTRLSSSRWRNTSIGVPRARCLISRSRVPGGPRRLASTFRARVVFTPQLSPLPSYATCI